VILEVKDIHTYYGESYILQGVSLGINRGEIVTLLGRNGAGKTTTIKSIVGLTPPKSGAIFYHQENITNRKPHEIVRLGIGYVPEDRRIFTTLTVLENLQVAEGKRKGMWNLESIFTLFPRLEERRKHKGNQLSGGEQQMLTIARSLMGNPELILVDEPSEGLAPIIVEGIAAAIKSMKSQGMAVLLVEQNVLMTLKLADRHYVIDSGKIIYQGLNEELMANREIQKRYLSV
jgi:branched-chain amino acid transport system ATP-binding protein